MICNRVAKHCAILFILITSATAQTYSGWSTGTPSLCRYAAQAAIGYSNVTGTIVIVGGGNNNVYSNDVIEFVEGSTCTKFSDEFVRNVYGNGQFWTQIGEYLYVIDPEQAHYFMRYNLETRAEEWWYESIQIPVYENYNTHYYGLFTGLTSINVSNVDYLVVLGGSKRGGTGQYVSMKDTQIVSLSTYLWVSNVPDMNSARRALACVTVGDTIYAIGGRIESGCCSVIDLDTVETLTITDMGSLPSSWSTLSNKLTMEEYMEQPRAVVYGTDILVFMSSAYDINVIDTVSDTISTDGYMPIQGSVSQPLVVGYKIYNFVKSEWRYMDFTPTTTSNPTSATDGPTAAPTDVPSYGPTMNPSGLTLDPSSIPSFSPSSATLDPSTHPSLDPTSHPSIPPSAYPSSPPTAEPSSPPTIHPTEATAEPSSQPTKGPSVEPTLEPTASPSSQPTKGPSVEPTLEPTANPSTQPSVTPSSEPTAAPSAEPSVRPSSQPTKKPTQAPSAPTVYPSVHPSSQPSPQPTAAPTAGPTLPTTTKSPTLQPTESPSAPSSAPSANPSVHPTASQTSEPNVPPLIASTSNPIQFITTNSALSEKNTSDSGMIFAVSVGGTFIVVALIVLLIRRMYLSYECIKVGDSNEGKLVAHLEKDQVEASEDKAHMRQVTSDDVIIPGAVIAVPGAVQDLAGKYDHEESEPQLEGVKSVDAAAASVGVLDTIHALCVKCGVASSEMVDIDGKHVCINCIRSNMNLVTIGDNTVRAAADTDGNTTTNGATDDGINSIYDNSAEV